MPRDEQRAGEEKAAPEGSALAGRLRHMGARLQEAAERALGHNALWAVLFVILLTPVVSQQECALPRPAYTPGEVAASDIKAPWDIEVIDEKATLQRRESARSSVPPVFDHEIDQEVEQTARLRELFALGRETLKARRRGAPPDPEAARRLSAVASEHAVTLSDATLDWLESKGYSASVEDAALRLLGSAMQARIVDRRERLAHEATVAVRTVRPGRVLDEVATPQEPPVGLEEARRQIAARVEAGTPGWSEPDRRALRELVAAYLAPNLSYNASETETRRARAASSIPQVFMRIPRGRVIVREGELFTAEAIDIISRMQGGREARVDWKLLGGHALLLALLAGFLHRYVIAHMRVFHRVKNLYTLCLLVAAGTAAGTWSGAFISGAVADRITRTPFSDPAAYHAALPVAAGAMLITLLANGRVATVCSAVIAVLVGMILGWDATAIVFTLLSCFAAIYGLSKYEKRTAILRASVLVGAANAGIVLALQCIETGFSPALDATFRVLMAAGGGVLIMPVVSFTLPILEWLFNVLTDIRLLELSNLDNPLLRRLSMEAPGTYNHSIIVGTLAEQAAEEIGAHALLCRVSAYYHDIGKMSKPDYFVENMREAANRHDRLSPRMSSLVIANHVKEGLRLAEQYGLPRQIRDIIPQHHGTRLITYFYQKAKQKEKPEVPEIHEHDYRYPGPKPQSKEAAIFMMADSVEAAARCVEEPTPGQFEEVIETIIEAIVLDRQLDECDLTFSDLARIRGSFLKTLTAVHHHRIDYPGFDFDRSRPRVVEAD